MTGAVTHGRTEYMTSGSRRRSTPKSISERSGKRVRVETRQWSDHCFAAYVFDGDRYGRFVGTEHTRDEARDLGEKRWGATDPAGVSDQSVAASVGELGWPGGSALTLRPPDLTPTAQTDWSPA